MDSIIAVASDRVLAAEDQLINRAIAATNRWVIRDLTVFMQFLAQNVICWDEQP